jgi:hypothetical protein
MESEVLVTFTKEEIEREGEKGPFDAIEEAITP